MKPLAPSNRHLSSPSARKQGVERNVRSSSAVEGISMATFRSAASGAVAEKPVASKTPRIKANAKKK